MDTIRRNNPPELFDSAASGFSQVTVRETNDKKVICVSGQTAWDANRNIVSPLGLHEQVKESLRNMEKALVSEGAALKDVLAMRIYILDAYISDTKAVTDALIEVFGEQLPCSTWIGVPSLAVPDFLVEIEPDPVVVYK